VFIAAPTERVASPRFVGLPDERCAITGVLVSSRTELVAGDGPGQIHSRDRNGWPGQAASVLRLKQGNLFCLSVTPESSVAPLFEDDSKSPKTESGL
jgi:hypothetical protein